MSDIPIWKICVLIFLAMLCYPIYCVYRKLEKRKNIKQATLTDTVLANEIVNTSKRKSRL